MKQVLIIDDHALIRDALRGVLKELADDAAVVEAADAREAMRLLGSEPGFDLILLDLNLPDRNGFAVLAELANAIRPSRPWCFRPSTTGRT